MSPNSFFSQPVFIPGGDPRTMNEPSLAKPGQLGIRFQYIVPARAAADAVETDEDGRPHGFQLVHTDSTMAVAPYDSAVAWWANQTVYRVTTSPTALGRGRVAGVFRTAVTPGNYCCVQQSGISPVKFIDVPTAAPSAAGLLVIPSATAGKADCLAAGSAATYPIMGRTVGALQGGTSEALVDLDIPEVY